jgi:Stage II sporulation protein E (SpoIIE)
LVTSRQKQWLDQVGSVLESLNQEAIISDEDRRAVVIYADGLTESFNSEREMLGVDGLQEIVAEASTLPLAEMKNQILNRVAAWRHGHAQDDVSLVLLEIS